MHPIKINPSHVSIHLPAPAGSKQVYDQVFLVFQLLRADCTFQIPNYLESLKLMNLADYAWTLEPGDGRRVGQRWPKMALKKCEERTQACVFGMVLGCFCDVRVRLDYGTKTRRTHQFRWRSGCFLEGCISVQLQPESGENSKSKK